MFKYNFSFLQYNLRNFILFFILLIVISIKVTNGQTLPNKFFIGTFQGPELSGNTDPTNTLYTTPDINKFQIIYNCGIDYIMYPYENAFRPRDITFFDQSHNAYYLYLASQTTGLKYIVTDSRHMSDENDYSEATKDAVVNFYKNTIPTSSRNSMFGYFVRDDPRWDVPTDAIPTQAWIKNLSQYDNDKFSLIVVGGTDSNRLIQENYIDQYINNVDNTKCPKIVIGGPYLTMSDTCYFYSLNMVKQKSGTKPFVHIINSISGTDNANDQSYIRFHVNTSIAYGAKGIIYFCAGCYSGVYEYGFVRYDGTTTNKYSYAQNINSFVKSVIDMTVFPSKYIGTYHKSDFYKSSGSLAEIIPSQNKITPSSPLIQDISDNNLSNDKFGMVGEFYDEINQLSYLYVVDKRYASSTVTYSPTITLKGDFTNKVFTYSNTGSISSVSTTFSNGNTSFQITNLQPGDAKLFKISDASLMFYTGGNLHDVTLSGTVNILNSLTVPSGATLTISPGTNLTFSSGAKLTVKGTLNASGTLSNRITINNGSIILDGSGATNSNLNYVTINNGAGIQFLNGANITIQNSILNNCINGIYIYQSSPRILSNQILEPQQNGIYGEPQGNHTWIYNNRIIKTSASGSNYQNFQGIYLYNSSTSYIANNDIKGFAFGAYFGGGSNIYATDRGNSIYNPNNRFTNNSIGFQVAWGSTMEAGYDLGYNSIYGNTINNVRVRNSGVLYAENNFWGANPNYDVDGTSTFTINPVYPNDPWAGIAKIAANNTNPSSGNASLSEGSSLSSEETELLRIALAIEGKGNFTEAIKQYKNMLSNGNLVKYSLSGLYRTMFEISPLEVLPMFNSMINSKNNISLASKFLADTYLRNGNFNDAIKLYDDIIKNYSDDKQSVNAKFDKLFAFLNIKKDTLAAKEILSDLKLTKQVDDDFLIRFSMAGSLLGIKVTGSNFKQNQSTNSQILKPSIYALDQNYPNPFNPTTIIKYSMPIDNHVSIKVFDVLGREVALLVNEYKQAGEHSITFDASKLANGVYVYKIEAGPFVQTRKMTLIK